MRLIDAKVLESTIQEQTGKCMIKIFEPSVNLILQDIRNAPTVDVEPVKHGRWILKDIWMECSNCKKTLIRDHIERAAVYGNGLPEYCPHCGAKMDLKDGETK